MLCMTEKYWSGLALDVMQYTGRVESDCPSFQGSALERKVDVAPPPPPPASRRSLRGSVFPGSALRLERFVSGRARALRCVGNNKQPERSRAVNLVEWGESLVSRWP
ncbi:hypothetical protein Enr13x_03610 [Stieleria neptunia]|uniref:Uncharacterized protein n=1 Tax=Stieleria neptunia TaxID=2527979 RepID=A0A518HI74_9BACT|nr:hypothetical protein Enr13x_03610 [Stieleria neptunia]